MARIRATIPQIAKDAGVSTATVDRALNGRKGVSAVNRQRVMNAARKLGYVAADGAVILPSRPARLSLLIPIGQNEFMRDVADHLNALADAHPLVSRCTIVPLEGIGAEAFLAGLDKVPARTDGLAVITTDHPRTRQAIQRACDAGLRIVTLASDVLQTPRSAYVGVDNFVAGRTAAQLMAMQIGTRSGALALCMGSRMFTGHQEREAGFRACISDTYPNLSVLPAIEAAEDGERLRRDLVKLLRSEQSLVGIYGIGAGRRGIVEAVGSRSGPERPRIIVHDLTSKTRAWLAEGLVDAVIDQDARLLAEKGLLHLLGSLAVANPTTPPHYIEPRIILRENIPRGRP